MLLRLLTLILLMTTISAGGQIQYQHQNNRSFTYEEAINAYQFLSEQHSCINMMEKGKTDVGRPLHLVVFNADEEFDFKKVNRQKKSILLINNAIHAGESCGVDASVKLMEYLATNKEKYKNLIVCVIPVYNIGGMLNRSKYNRSGQNGPVECGFRGNYQNLDLNRDFIKCDSKNARSFTHIFHLLDPDVFMDTHTTNGSDHQYTLSLITSQRNKMNPILGNYVYEYMEPFIYSEMKAQGKEIIPYVYAVSNSPDKGIKDFLETPRYSSGYCNLFNCISFISEAHKYKKFEQRVEHTYSLLKVLSSYANTNYTAIRNVRKKAIADDLKKDDFPIAWKLDTSTFDRISFKGYEAIEKRSEVTGQYFTTYDRSQPKTFEIKYFRNYIAGKKIKVPQYYVLPQAYPDVIELLRLNKVELLALIEDTLMVGECAYIDQYETLNNPYENHYLHYNVKTRQEVDSVQFHKGDVLIPTNQKNRRFIVEVLEAECVDSYFSWNFFDNILQQKEWFSPFAFNTIAARWLDEHIVIKKEFDEKKQKDSRFAGNHNAQLRWIFERTPYYEKSHNRYPIMKVK